MSTAADKFLGVPGYVVFWVLLAVALALFVQRVILLLRLIRLGKPEKRFDRLRHRLAGMLAISTIIGSHLIHQSGNVGKEHISIAYRAENIFFSWELAKKHPLLGLGRSGCSLDEGRRQGPLAGDDGDGQRGLPSRARCHALAAPHGRASIPHRACPQILDHLPPAPAAIRDRGTAPDAGQRKLVPGHGGRCSPEYQPDRGTGPGPGGRLRRRPYLPHGHPADGGFPQGQPGRCLDCCPTRPAA